MEEYLIIHGFMSYYTVWHWHGEKLIPMGSTSSVNNDTELKRESGGCDNNDGFDHENSVDEDNINDMMERQVVLANTLQSSAKLLQCCDMSSVQWFAMEESGDDYSQERQDMEELQQDGATSQPKPKKKGRGLSKGVQTTTPTFLEFDEFGLPTGQWESEYGKQIGTCSKKVDINLENMKKKALEGQEGTSSCEERGIDALTLALGKKDNRDHAKGLGRCGVGVGLTKAFEKQDRKGKRSSQSSCYVNELEAMKDSLT
uniref:Uncharacterized protein n=1 Tax=Chenopodium quinoa TaxID=63459 RepID=A0A803LIU3_CHEQI